jgi:2-hydroxychromene-2-carboxylate isomerase
MDFVAVVSALRRWFEAHNFDYVLRAGCTEHGICLTAVHAPSGKTVAVLRYNLMNKREFSRVLSLAERMQRHYDVVYATITRGAAVFFKKTLMARGIGLLRVTSAGDVVEEIHPYTL